MARKLFKVVVFYNIFILGNFTKIHCFLKGTVMSKKHCFVANTLCLNTTQQLNSTEN